MPVRDGEYRRLAKRGEIILGTYVNHLRMWMTPDFLWIAYSLELSSIGRFWVYLKHQIPPCSLYTGFGGDCLRFMDPSASGQHLTSNRLNAVLCWTCIAAGSAVKFEV
ncbi:hypothetical protein TNIN_194341 [Trichonephila inaurata madagascariensis]|uniref:Uncharacterized protein n=1 Tax=Trichonephila inaurata madagascariensis TaxID=2747483 RepID=A0A8X7C5T6_9ARAC|nr:hypothetical protein TNIN_194341 [Trichonephila inaurata madagascariensis]